MEVSPSEPGDLTGLATEAETPEGDLT